MPGLSRYSLDGADRTTNSMYGDYSSPSYERSYLPYLPKQLKNRSLDHNRQSLATSNEAYGRFWATTSPRLGTPRSELAGFRPAGLPSESEELDRHRQGGYMYMTGGYAAQRPSPRQGDRKDFKLPRISNSPHYSGNSYPSPPASPWKPYEPSTSPRVDLSKKLEFPFSAKSTKDRKIDLLDNKNEKVVASFDPNNDIHMPDIASIDLTVHMKDDSTIVLKSLPFTHWDKLH